MQTQVAESRGPAVADDYVGVMPILRMDNVGLVVDDLEAAVAFFLDLGVIPRDVGDAGNGWIPDCGVHPMMVVAMEPSVKSPGPGRFACVGSGIGPLL